LKSNTQVLGDEVALTFTNKKVKKVILQARPKPS